MDLKIPKITKKIKQLNLDAFLVSSPSNISYLANYPSRDSYLLISSKEKVYFTDSRYLQEAKSYLKSYKIKIIGDSLTKLLSKVCRSFRIKRLGFEEKYTSFSAYKKMKAALGKSMDLIPVADLIEEQREIKSKEELEKIKKAVEIAVKTLKFARSLIVLGRREIEIAAELERFIKYNGGSHAAFDIIVASGANSAFAHHITSTRKLRSNEPVLIDVGVDYQGYKSDLTRVFWSSKINAAVKRIYDIVLKAQSKAISEIKPGISAKEIDAAARQYIARKRFGGFFGHSLGHGIGLEVHEGPRIAKNNKDILKPGMVFTIEPGIYLPGRFGIRIEDMVLVTKKGAEVLSGSLNK